MGYVKPYYVPIRSLHSVRYIKKMCGYTKSAYVYFFLSVYVRSSREASNAPYSLTGKNNMLYTNYMINLVENVIRFLLFC